MKPLVSIVIPAHNAEEWIAEAAQSAIGQNWPRKERREPACRSTVNRRRGKWLQKAREHRADRARLSLKNRNGSRSPGNVLRQEMGTD